MALKTSEFLFGSGDLAFLQKLSDEQVLEVFEGIPQFKISKQELFTGTNIVDLLAENTQVFPSKGEAKKMILGGGVAINKEKVNNVDLLIDQTSLINEKFIVAQKGKKQYFLLIC